MDERLGYVCNPRSLKEGTETSRREWPTDRELHLWCPCCFLPVFLLSICGHWMKKSVKSVNITFRYLETQSSTAEFIFVSNMHQILCERTVGGPWVCHLRLRRCYGLCLWVFAVLCHVFCYLLPLFIFWSLIGCPMMWCRFVTGGSDEAGSL